MKGPYSEKGKKMYGKMIGIGVLAGCVLLGGCGKNDGPSAASTSQAFGAVSAEGSAGGSSETPGAAFSGESGMVFSELSDAVFPGSSDVVSSGEADPESAPTAAEEASVHLLEQIEEEDEKGFVYPEEYGGCYIKEEGQLVIGLTDLSEENVARYTEYCQTNGDVLEFVQMEYSYNELQRCANEIFGLDIEHIVTAFVMEKENAVYVGLDTEDAEIMDQVWQEILKKSTQIGNHGGIPLQVEYFGEVELAGEPDAETAGSAEG